MGVFIILLVEFRKRMVKDSGMPRMVRNRANPRGKNTYEIRKKNTCDVVKSTNLLKYCLKKSNNGNDKYISIN